MRRGSAGEHGLIEIQVAVLIEREAQIRQILNRTGAAGEPAYIPERLRQGIDQRVPRERAPALAAVHAELIHGRVIGRHKRGERVRLGRWSFARP